MRILYFNTPMGISGDMCLGALISLGVPLGEIEDAVASLGVTDFELSAGLKARMGMTGIRLSVRVSEEDHHRSFRDISSMIEGSTLGGEVKELAVRIFHTLAEAEAKVHGVSVDDVHFHEVGALDSIIDIVGVAAAVTSLKVDRVISSPLALGSGWVDTEHGRLPVPAPATLELVKGLKVSPSLVEAELTTPTGAAIIKTLAHSTGPMPDMEVTDVGCGLGSKDFKEAPNMVRAVLGESAEAYTPNEVEPVAGKGVIVLETNIDDMSPQVAGFLMERLLDAGALDLFYTPVQMKKSRPGVLLTVLTGEEKKEELLDIIFSESTSIGVRSYLADRHCLQRKSVEVDTGYGPVRVKVSFRDGRAVNHQVEYEDARAAALERGVPLGDVIDEVTAAIKAGVL